jgi:hypothetical protein
MALNMRSTKNFVIAALIVLICIFIVTDCPAPGAPYILWTGGVGTNTLFYGGGSSKISIDTGVRQLSDNSGFISADWQGRLLYNVSSVVTVDWGHSQLDGMGVTLDWGAEQLVSGGQVGLDWNLQHLVNGFDGLGLTVLGWNALGVYTPFGKIYSGDGSGITNILATNAFVLKTNGVPVSHVLVATNDVVGGRFADGGMAISALNGSGTNTAFTGITDSNFFVETNNVAGFTNAGGWAGVTFSNIQTFSASSNATISFTTNGVANGTVVGTQPTIDIAQGNNFGAAFQFSLLPNDGLFGRLYVNPFHDAPINTAGSPGLSELQWTGPHNLAFAPGYALGYGGHIQWFAGQNTFSTNTIDIYNTNYPDQLPSDLAPNVLQYTQPVRLDSGHGAGDTNNYAYPYSYQVQGNVQGNTPQFLVGAMGAYLSTSNGPYGIFTHRLYTDLQYYGGAGGLPHVYSQLVNNWSINTVLPAIDMFGGNVQATKIYGGVAYAKTLGQANTAYTIDLANAAMYDLQAGVTTIALSTSNAIAADPYVGQTTYGKCTVLLRAKAFTSVTVTYPTTWNTNGTALPASVPGTNMIRLELEWTGPGETNVNVLSASVLHDYSFYWDAATLAYMHAVTNSGTIALSNAINNLVISLKTWPGQPWNSLSNYYPFATQQIGGDKTNLINTVAWPLVYSGSPTTAGNHGLEGVFFDGSSYAKTGLTPGAATSSNISLFGWVYTNCTISGSHYIGGDYQGPGGLAFIGIGRNSGFGTTKWAFGANDFNSASGVVLGTNGPCTSRLISDHSVGFSDNVGIYDYWLPAFGYSTGSSGAPNGQAYFNDVYIGDIDNANSPLGWGWNGWIGAFAFGQGLSAMQYKTLYAATVNLNNALGR